MANEKKFVVRHGIITDNVQFNTGTSDTPLKGEILWNEEDGTLDVGLTDTGVVLQSGQEVHYRVSNVSGSSIPNGTLVMANGTNGNSGRINVVPAVADGSVPSKYIMGVVTEDIANDADGYVTHFGKVRGIDTSMWENGDILYADPNVAGGLTNAEPSAPNLKTVIAIVINSSATVGTIFVRPTYGSNLADDELVELSDLQDGDLIAFNGSAGRFENVSQSSLQVTGFTGSQGIQGNIGFTGSQGDQGNIGFTGSQGEDGVGGLDVSNMVGYSVTTTLASGFTAPSTSGLHYLISSIHVTNISTTAGWITADHSLSGGTPIQLANQIPVPAGSSIELLKRFKVMNPNDILRFQANANSSIHVTISYFIDNSNKYFRSGTDLTSTSVTDVFASSNTNGTYIESCMVTTDSSLDEKVTVTWTNSSNTIQGYFSYDLIVPANGSVELLEKPKFIANGNKIRAQAGSANAIEVLVAGRNR